MSLTATLGDLPSGAHSRRFTPEGDEEMSEANGTQVQQAAAFWQKALGEQIDRWEGMLGQLGKLETKGFEQVCANIDEAARLAKESTAYANLLTAQWRKLAVDSTRHAIDLFATKPVV
jgi:hypothetical protein